MACGVYVEPLSSVYSTAPEPVTRRKKTLKLRAAEVPMPELEITVAFAAEAVMRKALAVPSGLVLSVPSRVMLVSAQLFCVPPLVAKV